ncbi:MAG TPA: M50 family metallopeptidase [Candidatus Saccharimonadales bacterium]|nr:M50 family metallopeptidase [Candidatus Saccharimonadales bacterium]
MLSTLITLLVLVIILGVLVFVHELGHFLAARANGVRVEEFAFGFRPKIWSKKIGETVYAINAIPLGGYVKMYGETDAGETGPKSYHDKNPWQKFSILLAGAFANLVLGWLILTILFMTGFDPIYPGIAANPFVGNLQPVVVQVVAKDSPAAQAGLQVNDQLVAVNGSKVATSAEFIEAIDQDKGTLTTIEYKRADSTQIVTVTPRVNPPEGEGAVGVEITAAGRVSTQAYRAPIAAFYETGRIIKISAEGFYDFVKTLLVQRQVSQNVTGIIGVGEMTGVARTLGFSYLAQLVALVTIGLGVINLLPVLPLDGGHIIVVVYEGITRRKVTEKQFGWLAAVGLALVIVLFLIVTVKDIIRFDILGRFF